VHLLHQCDRTERRYIMGYAHNYQSHLYHSSFYLLAGYSRPAAAMSMQAM
jgi:hypothetical protein